MDRGQELGDITALSACTLTSADGCGRTRPCPCGSRLSWRPLPGRRERAYEGVGTGHGFAALVRDPVQTDPVLLVATETSEGAQVMTLRNDFLNRFATEPEPSHPR